jgi:SAM-dependent methyltransferase
MSGAKATDTVLDVACGGGVVACAFAARVKHVTGIDMTPAMLARGAEYAKEVGLTNLTWQSDITSLRDTLRNLLASTVPEQRVKLCRDFRATPAGWHDLALAQRVAAPAATQSECGCYRSYPTRAPVASRLVSVLSIAIRFGEPSHTRRFASERGEFSPNGS